MKFYLCQTEDGPQYQHLQSEAKKTDPNFQTIELDTSKGPLMDLLNRLMRQAHAATGAASEEPATVSRPAPPPTRSPAVNSRVERAYDAVGFEEFIWDVPADEAHRLDSFERIITERRKEIVENSA